MKKKFIKFFVLCLISAVVLQGCSSKDDATSQETTEEGRVKLSAIYLAHPLTKEPSEIEWLQKAEERAGVEIEWNVISSDWNQKKGTMLAGGDVPDLIIGRNGVTDAEHKKFKGLFQDLTELIETEAPNVQKMFEERPITKRVSTDADGKTYGISKDQRFWPDTGTRQYINHKWLDNLGLEMPTNWDELFEVLLAFKEQDANGNGDPNDEIPMDWAPVGTGGFGYFHPTVLLGSTGIALTAGGGQGFIVEDGQVKNFFVDERYKTFVKFLHEAWVAGVINPEVFTQDFSKFMANSKGDIKDETARVGYSFGWGNSDRFGNILYDQYTSMPALKVSADSTAELKWSYAHEQMNIMDNMIALSAASKNKKAAMRFVNELYDPEVSLQVLFGSIGPNISKNDDGSYTILPPKDESMDPGQWKWTSTWADNGPMFISDSLEVDLPIDMKQVLDESKPLQSAIDNIDKKKDLYPSFVEFSPDENSTIIRNNTSLMNIAMPKFGLWITEGGIDAEWDAYVEKFQSNGMQENVEIMQKYYDEIINQ